MSRLNDPSEAVQWRLFDGPAAMACRVADDVQSIIRSAIEARGSAVERARRVLVANLRPHRMVAGPVGPNAPAIPHRFKLQARPNANLMRLK
jgi:hypothetical protein